MSAFDDVFNSHFDGIFGGAAAQQQQGAFGQGLGGDPLRFGGQISQLGAQQHALNQNAQDALRYAYEAIRTERLPAKKTMKNAFHEPKTFREELQHDVDQWLKNAL